MPWTCLVRSANARGLGPDRAARADRPRLGRLLERPARGRDREEQIGIGGPAGGKLLPLAVGNRRATSARYGDSRATASSRRLGRGYALRHHGQLGKGVHGRVAGSVAKHPGEPMRQTSTGLPRRCHRHT